MLLFPHEGKRGPRGGAGTRLHMVDFIKAIAQGGRPVADIEEGHMSTASCILANISMALERPMVYDPNKRVVVGDPETTQLLKTPYREPWPYPEINRV